MLYFQKDSWIVEMCHLLRCVSGIVKSFKAPGNFSSFVIQLSSAERFCIHEKYRYVWNVVPWHSEVAHERIKRFAVQYYCSPCLVTHKAIKKGPYRKIYLTVSASAPMLTDIIENRRQELIRFWGREVAHRFDCNIFTLYNDGIKNWTARTRLLVRNFMNVIGVTDNIFQMSLTGFVELSNNLNWWGRAIHWIYFAVDATNCEPLK